jgi:hypothetical protein
MIYGSSDRAIVIEPSSGAPVVREAIPGALVPAANLSDMI